MKNTYKLLTLIIVSALPAFTFAFTNSHISSSSSTSFKSHNNELIDNTSHKETKNDNSQKVYDEKMSDDTREELKRFHEEKKQLQQDYRTKQEELRKTLSPEALKILEERKVRHIKEFTINKQGQY